MSDMVKVSICDGKYTIIQDASGRTSVLRHGEEWRDSTGDNVILGAAYEIQKLQERIKQLEDARTVAAANSLANMMSHEDAIAKIKRLEEFVEQLHNPQFTIEDLPKEALLQRINRLDEENLRMLDQIKQLEEGGDRAILNSYFPDRLTIWNKAKEANQ